MKSRIVFLGVIFICALVIVGCSNEPKSKWDGKTANFIGDSITANSLFDRKYPYHTKKELGLSTINNYGIGGSALSLRYNEFDEDHPPLVNRWDEIKEADVFFILIGTNDYSSQVPIGNSDSMDPGEFFGGLNIVLGGLKEKFPDKTIIVSTILKRKDNGVPIQVTEYNEAIKSKVEEYDLLLFDGYNIEDFDIGSDFEGNITDDNLHPNKEGAKVLGHKVAEFIESVSNE